MRTIDYGGGPDHNGAPPPGKPPVTWATLSTASKVFAVLFLLAIAVLCLPIASWALAHLLLPLWHWGFGAWS